MDEYFFYNTFKTYIIAFGNVFNNVKVKHGNGNIVNVPIRYSSKEKYTEFLLDATYKNPPNFEVSVPVIAYEMTGVSYDAARAVNQLKETFYTDPVTKKTKRVLAPSPYTLSFSLSIFTRYGDEMLQIVEQILPYFRPSFNITIKENPSLGIIERDVPITLTGVTSENAYAGAPTERRHIEWSMNFEVSAWLYPDGNSNLGDDGDYPIIRRVLLDFGADDDNVQVFEGLEYKADPFFANKDTADILKNCTYTEVFTGNGTVSSNISTVGESAYILGGLLTTTADQRNRGVQTFNCYSVAPTKHQYIEAEVRFTEFASGVITLANRVNSTSKSMYAVDISADGSAVIYAQKNDSDRLIVASLPADTIKSTDEVRLAIEPNNIIEDKILLHINNRTIVDEIISADYTQISNDAAVLISIDPTPPDAVFGIRWLRVGTYADGRRSP